MLKKRQIVSRILRTHFRNTEHRKKTNPLVYLNLENESGNLQQRLEIELFDNVSPLAAENFRVYCNGFEKENQNKGYKGKSLKVDDNKFFLMTDFLGESIYRDGEFLHENYDSETRFYYREIFYLKLIRKNKKYFKFLAFCVCFSL